MKVNERKPNRVLLSALFGVLLVFVVGRIFTAVYVDVLWFQSVEYSEVFWRRAVWEWGIRVAGMVLVGGAVYFNLRIVARTFGGIRIKRRLGDLEISEQLPKAYVTMAVGGMSVLMGLWFGASIPRSIGLGVLFLTKSPEWGLVDPVLGKDLMFYMLSLPVWTALVTFGMVLAFLTFSLSAAGYAATGAVRWDKRNVTMDTEPRKHLAMLVAAFFVFMSIRFFLGRYLLMLGGTSSIEGIFGFADAHARLPGLRILGVLAAFTAVGTIWSGLKGRVLPLAATFGGLIVGGLVAGEMYPAFVQRFQVEPNELDRETPFIENAIEFTKMGYGIENIDRRTFQYQSDDAVDWEDASAQFAGLPVWTGEALLKAYREVEARRRYYDFARVTIDRYQTPEGRVPVALSVREVDAEGIEDPNWQNLHLRPTFVSGLGAVASAAAGTTDQGRPSMYLSDIPVRFDESGAAPSELRMNRTGIFIGSIRSRLQSYAILNPEEHEALDGSSGVPGQDFPEGIQLNSLLKKLALAWHFQDLNLLFAAEVSNDSRLVFERQVVGRVQKISGDLIRFYEAPYPVLSEGRVVWMLEGFTRSRFFPLSSREAIRGQRSSDLKYIRNSVKITVDAVTGEVNYYVSDDADALLRAYRAGFPTLFKDLDQMPAGLREHIRYPRVLLSLQAEVLKRYHQETAAVFHRQQDIWNVPRELGRTTTPEPYLPEYGLYRLPGESEVEFLLSTAFVPDGRQNLAAILVARNDPGRLGELVLIEMPAGEQIPGPRQVEALVEQDPEISQQFSLWRTGGSEVWTGHLHLVPVGETLLYMEPVYLAAEEDAIPELRRFVVSDGRRVSMQPTLRAAILELAGGSTDFSPGEVDSSPQASLNAVTRGSDPALWPQEALGLLDTAEQRLRQGDYEGFGAALTKLRALLAELSGGSSGGDSIP
jgi:uncharacterized protein